MSDNDGYVLERFRRDIDALREENVVNSGYIVIPDDPDTAEWRCDRSEEYPHYYPTPELKGVDWIDSVYIQPGGCVEMTFTDSEDRGHDIHVCDFPEFVEQMTSLLECWKTHPERYT